MRRQNWGRATVSTIAALLVCCGTCATLVWPATTAQSRATAPATGAWSRQDAAHLLRRAGFSGTPEQIDRLQALGMDGAVDYLLTGNLPVGRGADAAPFAPAKLDVLHLEVPPGDDLKKGKQRNLEVATLRMQWVDRMIHTDRPLEEKMTLFWHGIFTSGIREVKSADQLLSQNQLFHRYALGNYRALALAIVHDPAMLKYLNNNENIKGKPNENLARELCELFTMGEGKGYTEKDVGEIARALTGAGARGKEKNPEGGYAFSPNRHDGGPKTIFGHTGNYMPDDVITLIFERPEPANYLARRLLTFFAFPDPTEADIAPIAAIIRENKYEVAPALRAILTSPAFYSERAKFSTIKSPADLVVGTIRMLDVPVDAPEQKRAAATAIGGMGEQLFQPPNVRGWPGGEDWITAATLFDRYNVATALVQGNLRPTKEYGPNGNKANRKSQDGAYDPPAGADAVAPRKLFPALPSQASSRQVVAAAIERFLQRPLHPEKVKVLVDELGPEPLRLGEPASDARIRQMLGLLLSTPEYQVE
jgi:uncharacterized protein (DUF1800 family)